MTERFTLSPPQPGDLGWVVSQHGTTYAAEYGFDLSFEGLVAGIVADFVARFDATREACWIARDASKGARLGSVFVVRAGPDQPQTAKLRMLILTPSARGMGLGGKLADTAIHFARDRGYSDMVLWTQSMLDAARHIYASRGFKLESAEPAPAFGRSDLVSEIWRLRL